MNGSEKQIAWAEDIKAQAFNNIESLIKNRNNELAWFGSVSYTEEAVEILRSQVIAAFEKTTDAAKIIEKRSIADYDRMKAMVENITRVLAKQRGEN